MLNEVTSEPNTLSRHGQSQIRRTAMVDSRAIKNAIFAVTFSAAAFISAESAAAQDAGPYVTGDIGIAFPEDGVVIEGPTADAGGTPQVDIDDNLIAGIGVGYDFGNGFRFEVESRFTELSSVTDPVAGTDTDGLDRTDDTFSFNTSSNIATLMANTYYDFDLGLPVKPYVKAGLGLSFSSTDGFLDTTIDSGVDDLPAGTVISDQAFENNKETDFTWALGAGVSYPLTDTVSLDMEYQYQDYGSVRTAFDETGDALRYSDIASHSLLTGLRIKF